MAVGVAARGDGGVFASGMGTGAAGDRLLALAASEDVIKTFTEWDLLEVLVEN